MIRENLAEIPVAEPQTHRLRNFIASGVALVALSLGVAGKDQTNAGTYERIETIDGDTSADASQLADRIMSNVITPPKEPVIPQDIIDRVSEDVVSIAALNNVGQRSSNCSGFLIHNAAKEVVAVQTSEHCLKGATMSLVYLGERHWEGPTLLSTDIKHMPEYDLAFQGVNGHTGQEGWEIFEDQLNPAALMPNLPVLIIGYPYDRVLPDTKEKIVLQLVTGGLIKWPDGRKGWSLFGADGANNKRRCTPRGSGSAILVILPGGVLMNAGSLANYYEFIDSKNMPTTKDGQAYWTGMRDYFGNNSNLDISRADFMCEAGTPLITTALMQEKESEHATYQK